MRKLKIVTSVSESGGTKEYTFDENVQVKNAEQLGGVDSSDYALVTYVDDKAHQLAVNGHAETVELVSDVSFTLSNRIVKLETRATTNESDIDTLETSVKTNATDIDSLESKVSTNTTNISTVNTKANTNATNITTANSRIDTALTNTSSRNSTAKLFVVGAPTQANNGLTYSNSNVYIGTDGYLYCAGMKVATIPSNPNQPYGIVPMVKADGVMEIGRYIDFHHDNSGSVDYNTRIMSQGGSNIIYLPTISGTTLVTSSENIHGTSDAGYMVLSNGLRLVWGRATVSANTSTTVTLPCSLIDGSGTTGFRHVIVSIDNQNNTLGTVCARTKASTGSQIAIKSSIATTVAYWVFGY